MALSSQNGSCAASANAKFDKMCVRSVGALTSSLPSSFFLHSTEWSDSLLRRLSRVRETAERRLRSAPPYEDYEKTDSGNFNALVYIKRGRLHMYPGQEKVLARQGRRQTRCLVGPLARLALARDGVALGEPALRRPRRL